METKHNNTMQVQHVAIVVMFISSDIPAIAMCSAGVIFPYVTIEMCLNTAQTGNDFVALMKNMEHVDAGYVTVNNRL